MDKTIPKIDNVVPGDIMVDVYNDSDRNNMPHKGTMSLRKALFKFNRWNDDYEGMTKMLLDKGKLYVRSLGTTYYRLELVDS